ncbi:hypothetical protein [Mycolicibacterium austroafricanum]|uniref:hypothetical protein n=1 Tax=Mycolicibacterium austroafricanum TaxID=39687 RepID=UPI001F3E01CD|nr:hypothetical protein [Mycolicibacterium austroafricanum]
MAAFLGKPNDAALVELAGKHLTVVKAMAKAYTRGVGFDSHGYPSSDDLVAVLITATARMVTHPEQIARTDTAGPFTRQIAGGFTGWTLAETMVLNRYRKRAG